MDTTSIQLLSILLLICDSCGGSLYQDSLTLAPQFVATPQFLTSPQELTYEVNYNYNPPQIPQPQVITYGYPQIAPIFVQELPQIVTPTVEVGPLSEKNTKLLHLSPNPPPVGSDRSEFSHSFSITKIIGNPTVPSYTKEWSWKILQLVELARSTFTSMSQIAVDDNPIIGAEIHKKLDHEGWEGVKVLLDFISEQKGSSYTSHRIKRQTEGSGEAALNKVGDIMASSNDKIEKEKNQLSPKAKKKMNRKLKDGLTNCKADSCKAAAATLKAAEDAEDERQ